MMAFYKDIAARRIVVGVGGGGAEEVGAWSSSICFEDTR